MRFKYFSCLAASVVKQWSSHCIRTNIAHCSWQGLVGDLDTKACRVHKNQACKHTCTLIFTVSSKTAGVTLAVAENGWPNVMCVVLQFYICACVFTWPACRGLWVLIRYIKSGLMPALCYCKLYRLLSRCFHYLKAICSPAAASF